jgi:folate-dependent tRNA-U54 methylase TrmFO/GidA
MENVLVRHARLTKCQCYLSDSVKYAWATICAPRLSAMGALARYVSNVETKNFQPVNITFALLEPLPEPDRRRIRKKRDRHNFQVELALREWDNWLQEVQNELPVLQA